MTPERKRQLRAAIATCQAMDVGLAAAHVQELLDALESAEANRDQFAMQVLHRFRRRLRKRLEKCAIAARELVEAWVEPVLEGELAALRPPHRRRPPTKRRSPEKGNDH